MTKIYRRLIIGVTLAISAFQLLGKPHNRQKRRKSSRNDYFLSDVRLHKTSRW